MPDFNSFEQCAARFGQMEGLVGRNQRKALYRVGSYIQKYAKSKYGVQQP